MDNGNTDSAFEQLAAEVQRAIEHLNQQGAEAFQGGNYEKARLLMDKGPKLIEFQSRLNDLWQEWNVLMGGKGAAAHSAERVREVDEFSEEGGLEDNGAGTDAPDMRESSDGETDSEGKLPKVPALRPEAHTTEQEFLMPILQALVSFGGSSTPMSVIEKVQEIMKPRLNEYDLMPLDSDPSTIRWQHSVQWASAALIQQGLMKSEGNEWEVSQTGKHWLAKKFETT